MNFHFSICKSKFEERSIDKKKKKSATLLPLEKIALRKDGCEKSCFQQLCSASAIYTLLCLPLFQEAGAQIDLLMHSDATFLFKMLIIWHTLTHTHTRGGGGKGRGRRGREEKEEGKKLYLDLHSQKGFL